MFSRQNKAILSLHTTRKRSNGSASYKQELLSRGDNGTLRLERQEIEAAAGRGHGDSEHRPDLGTLGVSFNLQLSEKERSQRDAVELPHHAAIGTR